MITERFLKGYWARIREYDAARKAKQSSPDGITDFRDIAYSGGGADNLLDVFIPDGAAGKLPVIIDVHGGGWTYGDKELNEYYCMNLAKRGFAVVDINYHLLWTDKLVQSLRDVFDACDWVRANGGNYPFDTNNIFITGDSAGGHLAVAAAAISVNPKLKELIGVNSDIKFNAVGSVCGALALDMYGNNPLLSGLYRMMFGKRPRKSPLFNLAYIVRLIDADTMPPMFFSSCTKDALRKHSLKFEKFCQENNVRREFFYADQRDCSNHLTHVYNVLYPHWDESIAVDDAMCAYFRKYIKS